MSNISAIWRTIEGSPPPYGEYEARRVTDGVDCFLAISHDGVRHVLLPVASEQNWLVDTRSRGLAVKGRNLKIEGNTIRPFLDVSCSDRNGHDAFNVIAHEITDLLLQGQRPEKAVSLTLDRWRRFWSNTLNGALSAEQVRGLFGELWFLSIWLLPHTCGHIRHWVGPAGVRHDFQWPEQSVEVKATISSKGHVHHINGIDQLEPPAGGPLYLFSLRLREELGATNTLVTLIQRISGQLAAEPASLDLFETKLSQVGYSPAHNDHYSQTRFQVVEERLYVVGDSFPRINSQSFQNGVPAGVETITYVINLDAFANLCISRSAAQPGINVKL